MAQSANLFQEINGFYRRWHSFESTLGKDAGSVLDFDYCPPEDTATGTPFSDRLAVLDELERLQSDVQASSGSFSNKDFLRLKLEGANAYLRTLMGERLPFERYLEATIGITPKPLPKDELAALRESA